METFSEYSAPLTIEQIVQEQRTFDLDRAFVEGWTIFKQYPVTFSSVCFLALLARNIFNSLHPLSGMMGEAIFWGVLPVLIAFMTWDTLQGKIPRLTNCLPQWCTTKKLIACSLILSLTVFALSWLDDTYFQGLFTSESLVLETLLSIIEILMAGFCLVFLLVGSIGLLVIANRGTGISEGLRISLQVINYQSWKVILLHVGWMINTGVLAVIVGGISWWGVSTWLPEDFLVIQMDRARDLSFWAEDVSKKTGEVTLNLLTFILESVGVAVGFAFGLCTVAVAYARIFGLSDRSEKPVTSL